MSQNDRNLPPGPNPRGDQMTEKDQRQLREHMRQKNAGGNEGEEEWSGPDQAEGGRKAEHARKIRHTPDQAEGDRETIEKELEKEKKPH